MTSLNSSIPSVYGIMTGRAVVTAKKFTMMPSVIIRASKNEKPTECHYEKHERGYIIPGEHLRLGFADKDTDKEVLSAH